MNKKTSKFSQPTGQSGALSAVQTSYADPLEVDYRGLKEGEGVVIRILSLSEEHIAIQPNVYAATASAKHKDKAPINRLVPLPENEEDAENIFDDNGIPLSDGDPKQVWFIPVFTLYKVDKDGLVSEEINELQYLKAGPGIVKSIKELSEDVKNDYEFDAIPPYDIRIEAFKNGEITNWKLQPVTTIITKKGKDGKQKCERFGVEDLSEALGAETWDAIVDSIDELMEHYNEVVTKEQSVNSIKKRFLHYRSADGAATAKPSTRSTGMSRDLPTADPDEEGEENEEVEQEEAGTPKFRGLGNRFKK